MTEEEYEAKLAELSRLMDAAGPYGDDPRLGELAAEIEAYEDAHFPMGDAPA